MGLAHSPRIVTKNLVFGLDFANNRSYGGTGTTCSDIINSNVGTFNNSPSFSNNNGGILSFDGGNDYISIPNHSSLNPSTTGTWTIVITINPTFVSNQFLPIIGKNDPNDYELSIDTRDGKNNGLAVRPDFSTNISNFFTGYFGTWLDICVVIDGGYAYAYRNSEYIANHVQTTSTSTGNLFLGRRDRTFYYGLFDLSRVLMYDGALTADEIRQNYLASRGRYK